MNTVFIIEGSLWLFCYITYSTNKFPRITYVHVSDVVITLVTDETQTLLSGIIVLSDFYGCSNSHLY